MTALNGKLFSAPKFRKGCCHRADALWIDVEDENEFEDYWWERGGAEDGGRSTEDGKQPGRKPGIEAESDRKMALDCRLGLCA